MTTAELARRLERAEGAANAALVEARMRLQPDAGAAWIEVAGVYAMFDGVSSPLTQSFGLGLFDRFLGPEFDRVEAFYRNRGALTFHEVCELAEAETVRLLEPRGYRPIEQSTVLVRSTAPAGVEASPVSVRVADQSEATLWSRIAAQGWANEAPDLVGFLEELGAVTSRAEGVHCFLAELDGTPVAAGALNLAQGVALLAGASTIPAARKRGAQRALLQARLSFAAARGFDLAMVVTQPQGASRRNAERQGFRPVYGRTKWQLAS